MSKESWLGYCYYLKEWAENHRSTVYEGCSPVGYEEWLEYEAQSQPAERYKLVGEMLSLMMTIGCGIMSRR